MNQDLSLYHLLDNTGKYSAELVKTVGENQYLINLIIRNVSQADGEEENYLRVTVKEREFTVPIILDAQKEWGEVLLFQSINESFCWGGFVFKS